MRGFVVALLLLVPALGCSALFNPDPGRPDGSNGASTSSGSATGGDTSSSTTAGGSTGTSAAGSTASSSGGASSGGVITTALQIKVVGQDADSPAVLTDVGISPTGSVLAATAGANTIIEVDGGYTVWAGNGDVFEAEGDCLDQSAFAAPIGLATFGSLVYVADEGGGSGPGSIRVIDTSGGCTVSTLVGAGLNHPDGVAVGPDGTVYVADTSNNRICKITEGACEQVAGDGTQGFLNANGRAAKFALPAQLAVDAQNQIWVADSNNNVIRKIAANGDVSTFATLRGAPYGVAVDSAGNVYASAMNDAVLHQGEIREYAPDGTLLAQIHDVQIDRPRGLKVDAQGRVIVANTGDSNVLRITLR